MRGPRLARIAVTGRRRGLGARARLVVVALAISAPAPAATPGVAHAAQQPEPLVTHDEAMRALRAFDRANAGNNASLGVEGQREIESDPVRLIDDASFHDLRNRGEQLGDQGVVRQRRVHTPLQVVYPAQFLAEERVRLGGESSTQLLAFTRTSATTPWTVTLAAQLGPGAVMPALAEDAGGAATLLDAHHAAALKLPPERVAAELAALWARVDATGVESSDLFEAGPLTTGAIDGFVNELAATGIDGEVELGFEAAPYAPVAYLATRGRALVLFAVAVHETIRPRAGAAALVQPRSRDRFGGLVVAGRYASVDYERLALVAAVVPPAGSNGKGAVIGSYTGVVRASAVPATGRHPPPRGPTVAAPSRRRLGAL